jgi:hypothetical protein
MQGDRAGLAPFVFITHSTWHASGLGTQLLAAGIAAQSVVYEGADIRISLDTLTPKLLLSNRLEKQAETIDRCR